MMMKTFFFPSVKVFVVASWRLAFCFAPEERQVNMLLLDRIFIVNNAYKNGLRNIFFNFI